MQDAHILLFIQIGIVRHDFPLLAIGRGIAVDPVPNCPWHLPSDVRS
jgi:hypothetical protein